MALFFSCSQQALHTLIWFYISDNFKQLSQQIICLMIAKQMLQLQQEDIIKAAHGNVFTNSLLNQQKSD